MGMRLRRLEHDLNTHIRKVVFGQELGRLLLSIAADLANHHDALGVVILQENVQAVDEVGSIERIAANANAQSLAKTGLGGLVDSLVSWELVSYSELLSKVLIPRRSRCPSGTRCRFCPSGECDRA